MNNQEIENRGIEDKLFQALCNNYKVRPFTHTMGLQLMYLGEGTAGVRMSVEQGYTSINGRLQGGIIATIADNAMGWAIGTLGRTSVTTIDIRVNYFAPVFEGTELTAEGYVIHAGKSTAVAEASLFNDKGKLVAKSMGTFISQVSTPKLHGQF